MHVVDLIRQVAEVPSFSSREDRLHPLIHRLLAGRPGVTVERVPEHNLLVCVPGNPELPTVALAAHLDKIDHWGTDPQRLAVELHPDRLVGSLDDAVGMGLCLALADWACERELPPLQLLFSEMEESHGLNHHPERLVAGGAGRESGQGASRLSRHLRETGRRPAAVITIDTTPLFRGESGVALYAAPWEQEPFTPGPGLLAATAEIVEQMQALAGGLRMANNNNDYAIYGLELNRNSAIAIPSVAVEPAIFPYHGPDEGVYVSDILRVERLIQRFLESWTRTTPWPA
ncbi:MAG: hypothetical protein ACK50P_17115 [Planctomycetaceae bacterium]